MLDAIELALQYGPIGGLGLIIVLLIIMHEKKDGRIVKNLKKNFDKIEALEKKDIESDGRFDNIDDKLDSLTTGVNKIIDHFVAEGMKK